MQLGLTYRLYCFNFHTNMLFLMYYIKKVFYSIKTRLGYVFRFCFPHRVMNLRNVKSNRKISCNYDDIFGFCKGTLHQALVTIEKCGKSHRLKTSSDLIHLCLSNFQ